MTLAAGTKLGPYEILAPIGAGGMGEVYRARDPRLVREVAIKVLPASFSQDADHLKRFEQEARAFADAQGYSVDWASVERLDDQTLINGVSQIAPFDFAAKQALLEAPDLSTRCELLIQLMQFFALRDDDGNGRVTLQ